MLGCDGTGMAERSYPVSQVGRQLGGATPGLRHAVAPPGGQEEQSQVQGAVAARAQEDL